MADRLGHSRAFLIGSLTFTVASVVCGLAPSIELLILAPIVQGAGAAAGHWRGATDQEAHNDQQTHKH